MKKILVATDGSDHAANAVKLAADLTEKYNAKLVIAHVVDDKPLVPAERMFVENEFGDRLKELGTPAPEALAEYGSAGLRGYLRSQDSQNLAVKTVLGEEILRAAKASAGNLPSGDVETVLLTGDPTEQIIESAEKGDANLIVIGSRGLGGLEGMWLGSVSHKVASQSPINVVTVR